MDGAPPPEEDFTKIALPERSVHKVCRVLCIAQGGEAGWFRAGRSFQGLAERIKVVATQVVGCYRMDRGRSCSDYDPMGPEGTERSCDRPRLTFRLLLPLCTRIGKLVYQRTLI